MSMVVKNRKKRSHFSDSKESNECCSHLLQNLLIVFHTCDIQICEVLVVPREEKA